ncbi:MAG: hypothetical protein KJZ83_06455 [Burkholderiaceae bacterium]|nr:hypothetical protein [Burkholderiaceae bacterium]
MPRIHRGIVIEERAIGVGCASEPVRTVEFLDTSIDELDAITRRYDVSAHVLAFGWTPRLFGRPDPPWAIVALPQHYPIIGHLISARRRPTDYSVSYYAKPGEEFDPSAGIVPPAGMLFVFDGAGLALAVKASPCLAAVARNLDQVPSDGTWLVIADPLPAGLVAQWAVDNGELFWKSYRSRSA